MSRLELPDAFGGLRDRRHRRDHRLLYMSGDGVFGRHGVSFQAGVRNQNLPGAKTLSQHFSWDGDGSPGREKDTMNCRWASCHLRVVLVRK